MKRRIKVTKVKPLINSKNPKIKTRLKLVESMAIGLMTLHGVSHFKFKFSGARRKWGSCSSNTIRLSINHALSSDIINVENTVLHEIAHAIVGVNHGHREAWQNRAKELGVVWKAGRYRK
jgi:predicted metal-dependent hydrolase